MFSNGTSHLHLSCEVEWGVCACVCVWLLWGSGVHENLLFCVSQRPPMLTGDWTQDCYSNTIQPFDTLTNTTTNRVQKLQYLGTHIEFTFVFLLETRFIVWNTSLLLLSGQMMKNFVVWEGLLVLMLVPLWASALTCERMSNCCFYAIINISYQ